MADSRSLTFNFLGKDSTASRTFSSLSKDAEGTAGHFSRLGSAMAGIGRGVAVAGVAAAGAAVAGLGAVFHTGLGEVMDYQSGLSQLRAGIKSTGGAAGISAPQMEALASSIQRYSGQTDDSIVKTESLLLTFTNIRDAAGKNNDIFTQTTKIAADMAARMGGDASSAAIQLGKALNDPVKGITALTRVGVSFTQGQKDQITAMVDAGNTMGAQKLILGELNKEFGGSAKAIGKTLPGQIQIAKRSFEDFAQSAVTAVLPAISGILGGLSTGFQKAQPLIRAGIKGTATVLHGIVDVTRNTIIPGVQHVFDDIKPSLTGFITNVRTGVQNVGGQIIGAVTSAVRGGDFGPLGQLIGAGITRSLTTIGNVLSDLTDLISGWFSKVDWVGIGITMGKQAPALLVGLVAGLLNFDVGGLLKGLAHHWQDILFAVIAVAFTPAKIIGKVAEMLGRIPLAGRLIKWGFEEFAKFSKTIVGAVFDAVKAIGGAFVRGLLGENGRVVGALRAMLTHVVTSVYVYVDDFLRAGLKVIKGLGDGILRGAETVGRAVRHIISLLLKPFAGAGKWLYSVGADLIRGLGNGIESMAGSVVDKAKGIGHKIVGGVKGVLHIGSPSRLFHQFGLWVMEGFQNGLQLGGDKVVAFMQHFTDRMKTQVQAMLDGIHQQIQNATDRLNATLQAEQQLAQSITGNLRSFAGFANMPGPSTPGGGAFSSIGGSVTTGALMGGGIAGALAANRTGLPVQVTPGGFLHDQLDTLRHLARVLKQLRQAGFSPAIVNQIAQLDPAQAIQVGEELLSGDSGSASQVNKTERQIQHLTSKIGKADAADVYGGKIDKQTKVLERIENKTDDERKTLHQILHALTKVASASSDPKKAHQALLQLQTSLGTLGFK